ncbi:HAD family hydrolase [Acetobacteraceae bacterium]|nr:HAD family hydrolase [Acetobacteraceae bacterium]
MPFSAIPFEKLKLIVFDVDGTLYPQFPIRRNMVVRLLWELVKNRSFRTSNIIQDYRHLREKFGEDNTPDFSAKVKKEIQAKYHLSSDEYDVFIEEWLYEKPLSWLVNIRFPEMEDVFEFLKQHKIKIGILSDFPAEDKISKLHLTADYIYWAEDAEIQSLKPNPKGLFYLMEKAGVTAEETLMIGDRDDRDGEMARRANAHFLLRGKPNKKTVNKEAYFIHWGYFLDHLKAAFNEK